MWLRKVTAAVLCGTIWLWSLMIPEVAYGQNTLPTPDQLDQLLAPVALYPDALLAQICAASTDPQQILDADSWLSQNLNLTGQARTDAAQQQGFDPAFIALVNFPQVLDMMAQNINDYAAIGQAFSADQGSVMASVQRLRQQAYASGALQSNQHQTVQVQTQGGSQVVVIQPANPQVVYIPQYNPAVVFAGPSTGAIVAASVLSFGAGIALGSWISGGSQPWGWGGWGWNWGRNTVIVNNNYWVVNNRYRPPNRTYRYRPPAYNRPIYARPPNNWNNRPYYRPVSGGRPPSSGYRPPPSGGRPPGANPGYRPPSNGARPPVTNPGNRPANPPNRPARPSTPTPNPQRPPQPNRPSSNPPARPARPSTPTPNPQRPPQPNRPSSNPSARPARPSTPTPNPQRPPQPNRPSSNPSARPAKPSPSRPNPQRPPQKPNHSSPNP